MKELNVEIAQNFINLEFEKILQLKLDRQVYNIAIRQDQVPKLEYVSQDEKGFTISFTKDAVNLLNYNGHIALHEDNSLIAFKIDNCDKLKVPEYRDGINLELSNHVSKMKESNKEEVILKHIENRIVHAIKEIIKNYA